VLAKTWGCCACAATRAWPRCAAVMGDGNRIIRVLENGEPLGKVNRSVRRGALIKR